MQELEGTMQELITKAAESLEKALKEYLPLRAEGYDLPETNAVMYFAQALKESGWLIYPEVPVEPATQRLDLLALQKGPTEEPSDGGGHIALCVEAKRIWAPGHAANVLMDIEKLEQARLSKKLLETYGACVRDAVLVVTHRQEVAQWWKGTGKNFSALTDSSEAKRRARGYGDPKHKSYWEELGRKLAKAMLVCVSPPIKMEERHPPIKMKERQLFILFAMWDHQA